MSPSRLLLLTGTLHGCAGERSVTATEETEPTLTLQEGQATGQLPGGPSFTGAVTYRDSERDGRLTLLLTSFAEPSCGLVDWGHSRAEGWTVLQMPQVAGGVEAVRFEGSPVEDETWGLRRTGTLEAFQVGGSLPEGFVKIEGEVIRYLARDCGDNEL